MAGSRLEKWGTVFTRTRDLMRSGVIPESKKPIWFDVYAAFPPLKEPVYKELRPLYGKVRETVPAVLYKEDEIRAKFYEAYGNGPKAFELSKLNFKSTCQRFVEKYTELQKQSEVEEDRLFEETGKALLAEGIILRRKTTSSVAQQGPQEGAAKDAAVVTRLQSVLQKMQDDSEAEKVKTVEAQKEDPSLS
ncbi:small ribosomal subunit protein mS23 [Heteronotia binoei]|uniref:small ribosomal subunit protein mS23 n=1 Tax=Heteronotia binoei TaxID=13085 RepID=UPI00292D0FA9|nr:small ribosomal subunit protein mS23 [Heteronotia binoei]